MTVRAADVMTPHESQLLCAWEEEEVHDCGNSSDKDRQHATGLLFCNWHIVLDTTGITQ